MNSPRPDRINYLMALAMLIVGCVRISWTERLMAGGGFGWDGAWYSRWARDFYNQIFVVRVPEYYVQRILPSAVVHYTMRLIGAPFTRQNLIFAFDVLNLVLLVIGTFVWGLIADKLKVSVRGKWLGAIFLIANYAILKHNFYHSVLTDTSAFVCGILIFYFYLSDRPVALLVTTVAGAFVWPIIAPFAMLLFVFPRRREEKRPEARPIIPHGNVVVAGLVTLLGVAALLYLIGPKWRAMLPQIFGTALRVNFGPIYLSIACTALYLFFGLKAVLADDALFDPRRILAEIRWRRVAVGAVVMVALKVVQHSMANGQPDWTNLKMFACYTLLTSVSDPALFLVAHVTYLGPAVLLLVFFWKRVCGAARELGMGMQLALILAFVPSLNSQTRYGINLVAWFFALLVVVLDRRGIILSDIAVITILSLAWSKVWFTMNTGPQIVDGTMENLLRPPLQRYFMNSGPWMSHEMYLVHVTAALATAIALYGLVVRRSAAPAAELSAPGGRFDAAV